MTHGNEAHFHFRDVSTQGREFEARIRIDIPEYSHDKEDGRSDYLNLQQIKLLIKFLNSFDEDFGTKWKAVISEWNRNNSKVRVDRNQKMPDYTKLK